VDSSRRLDLRAELGFFTDEVPNDAERMHGLTLTASEQLDGLLARVCRLLQTSKPSVAASQFTKWYCRSLVAVLYEFSVLGIARSATLRDISVLFPGEPLFAIHCNGRTVPVTDSTRES